MEELVTPPTGPGSATAPVGRPRSGGRQRPGGTPREEILDCREDATVAHRLRRGHGLSAGNGYQSCRPVSRVSDGSHAYLQGLWQHGSVRRVVFMEYVEYLSARGILR